MKLNIKATTRTADRQIITLVGLNSMVVGVGWCRNRGRLRCVRWMRGGLCQYILLGSWRGKVVPTMRQFRKSFMLSPAQEARMLRAVSTYKKLDL
jgi:hypothetical protein